MIWQTLLDVDKQLLLALNGDGGPFWDNFFYVVSAKLTWVPLYVLLLYCIWRRMGWRGLLWSVVILGVSVGLADQICNFFKHYTPKFRPTHTPDIEMWVHTVKGYRGGLYGRCRPTPQSALPLPYIRLCCFAGGGIRYSSWGGHCSWHTVGSISGFTSRWISVWGRFWGSRWAWVPTGSLCGGCGKVVDPENFRINHKKQ